MVQEGDLYHDVSATRCDWSLPMIYQSTRHMDDVTKNLFSWFCSTWRPGGALGYRLGGYVPPGTPNCHPVLKKISPKIDTPF